MSLTYIDQFHPGQRALVQAALDAKYLYKRDELALLEAEQMRPLAFLTALMLLIGGLFFILLNLLAYYWHTYTFSLRVTLWGGVSWIIVNILAYVLILLVHEVIHGLAFLFWGGHPYFGAHLPLALYCGAKEQLFSRNHYLIIGLAPLVVITLAGIVVTLLFPSLASYVLFATIGNFSGASGDLLVAKRLLRLPKSTLVEDTETGYRAWSLDDEKVAF